jgi:hypothetical protein
MTFQEALALKARFERTVAQASARLRQYPRFTNGRVPDNTRLSYSYQQDRAAYKRAHTELRAFNELFLTQFKTEYREHLKQTRTKKGTPCSQS